MSNTNQTTGASTSEKMPDNGKKAKKTKRKGWGSENGFEEWGGYMNCKKQKLHEQFLKTQPRAENTSDIFKGVSIYVNGYTKPSSDELKRLMFLHGGTYQQYLSKTYVTHVIATQLAKSKIDQIKSGDKIVKPEWILDSIKAGRLLNYEPYQLYTAQSGTQKGIAKFAQPVQKSTRPYGPQATAVGPWSKVSPKNGERTSSSIHQTGASVGFVDGSKSVPENNNIVAPKPLKRDNLGATSNYHGNRTISSAGDSTFVSEFYNNSRLHHLSTWKSEFAEYVNQLQLKGDGNYPGRQKLIAFAEKSAPYSPRGTTVGKPERVIMHVDMDCFFVSVGLRERPELRGKPIAVTHSKGKGGKLSPGANLQLEKAMWESGKSKRKKSNPTAALSSNHAAFDDDEDFHEEAASNRPDVTAILNSRQQDKDEGFYSMAEIASCSYEARKAGVKNGMFMGGAKKLCPELVTIPYDFDKYNEVSKQLYDIVASFTHDIEAVSCDEMLVDCTDLLSTTGISPLDFATVLRQEIWDKTQCPASVGLASNILLAKLATKRAKPNGQFYLDPSLVLDFISPQLVKDLPGIGWAMTKRLSSMNITTCADMQTIALTTLQKEFGPKIGQSLYRNCRGQDDRPIKMDKERKSVSAEINYGIRFKQNSEAEKFLSELSEEVANRLKKIGSKGKSITLKLKVRREDAPVETAKFLGHGICNQVTKSVTLPLATDNAKIIAKEVITILRIQKINGTDLRGIGIQMQRLEPAVVGKSNLTKGHNSILNFAVRKTSPKMTPRTSPQPDTQGKFKLNKMNSMKPVSETQAKRRSMSLSKNRITNNNDIATLPMKESSISKKVLTPPISKEITSPEPNNSSLNTSTDLFSPGVTNDQNFFSKDLIPSKSINKFSTPKNIFPVPKNNLCKEKPVITARNDIPSPKNLSPILFYENSPVLTNNPPTRLTLKDSSPSERDLSPVLFWENSPITENNKSVYSASTDNFTPQKDNSPVLFMEVSPEPTNDQPVTTTTSRDIITPKKDHSPVLFIENSSAVRNSKPHLSKNSTPSTSYHDFTPLRDLSPISFNEGNSPMAVNQATPPGPVNVPSPIDDDFLIPCGQKKFAPRRTRLFQPGHLEDPPLPSLTSPGLQSSPVSLPCTPEVQQNLPPDDYFPSPSQIDPEVLRELPTDIREQVQAMMQDKLSEKMKKKCQPIVDRVEQAGCSHWSSQPVIAEAEPMLLNVEESWDSIGPSDHVITHDAPERMDEDGVIVPLPSPSQIDPDCMSALPDDLQRELRQAYVKQGKNQPLIPGPPKISALEAMMAAASSPPKKKSPSKKGRPPNKGKSPQFKIPKGKPGRKQKHNPKKLDFASKPTRKASENEEPSTSDGIRSDEVKPQEKPERVNLCGREALDDVKDLLRLWLHSGSAPESEDLEVISEYLGKLVLDKNLEFVDLLLKFLQRQVPKLDNEHWNEALVNIILNTQGVVYAQYASHLKGLPT